MNAAEVAAALSKPGKGRSRRKGRGWMAPCPAHNDDKPSLSLNDGRSCLLYHCHAGCSQEEVGAALADFVGTGTRSARQAPKAKTVIVDSFEVHVPSADEAGRIDRESFYHHVLGAPSAIWSYTDTAGTPVLFVARYETEDGKEIVPWSWQRRNGMAPRFMMRNWEEKRPLYNLKDLAARPEAPVLYVEGEKAAGAARKLFPAFVVTTHAGGGCAYEKTDLTPLRGRLVVIQPDCDEPGEKMANGLAMALQGIARRTVKMPWPARWPDGRQYQANDSDDAFDHAKAGWTHDLLVQAKERGDVRFVEIDPTAQFGEGTGEGPGWPCVTVRGDEVVLMHMGVVVAECGLVAWRAAVDVVEADINRRLERGRHGPGRFPRHSGRAPVAFAFAGQVYLMMTMLKGSQDPSATKAMWLDMPAYLRDMAFRKLDSMMRRERKAAA